MKVGYLGVIALAKRRGSKKRFWTHVLTEYDEEKEWGASPCGWAGIAYFLPERSEITCWRCKRWLRNRK